MTPYFARRIDSEGMCSDDQLVIWFTRGDFRRFLKADLGHDPTDSELDDTLCCSDTTDLINAVVDNYADGDELDFLKRKGE